MGFDNENYTFSHSNEIDMPHLANTFSALCILLLCDDFQFSKVKRKELISKLPLF